MTLWVACLLHPTQQQLALFGAGAAAHAELWFSPSETEKQRGLQTGRVGSLDTGLGPHPPWTVSRVLYLDLWEALRSRILFAFCTLMSRGFPHTILPVRRKWNLQRVERGWPC